MCNGKSDHFGSQSLRVFPLDLTTNYSLPQQILVPCKNSHEHYSQAQLGPAKMELLTKEVFPLPV